MEDIQGYDEISGEEIGAGEVTTHVGTLEATQETITNLLYSRKKGETPRAAIVMPKRWTYQIGATSTNTSVVMGSRNPPGGVVLVGANNPEKRLGNHNIFQSGSGMIESAEIRLVRTDGLKQQLAWASATDSQELKELHAMADSTPIELWWGSTHVRSFLLRDFFNPDSLSDNVSWTKPKYLKYKIKRESFQSIEVNFKFLQSETGHGVISNNSTFSGGGNIIAGKYMIETTFETVEYLNSPTFMKL